MRRVILTVAAVLGLAASTALAQAVYPKKIALPDGFAPEGIEIAKGKTFYVGSVANVASTARPIALTGHDRPDGLFR